MEDRLRSSETQKELAALQRKLELMEEEKMDCQDKCSKAEVEVKDLRFTGEESALLYTPQQTIESHKHPLNSVTLRLSSGLLSCFPLSESGPW